uniref:Uncharacterized protein n=1 Tax=Cajanus cajan TaxID=3821 RepID=A0A151UGB0_CAJCA
MKEKLNNGEASNEKPIGSVVWEGDVYSQVLGAERSGYVRGLGLGPTPSLLWGSKSSIGSTFADNISNEVVQRLEQEVKMLKEIKEKHDEEMNLMKQNQDKLLSELSFIRKFMYKHFPMELSMPQKFNGSSFGQV